jgi:hypothetical protein
VATKVTWTILPCASSRNQFSSHLFYDEVTADLQQVELKDNKHVIESYQISCKEELLEKW